MLPAEKNAAMAVAYARVSSKEQEQGYSIPAQQDLLQRYASRMGVSIAREFVDVESARSSGRAGFTAMVAYLREHPECRVVLVEKTDRLYRNLKDYITVDELGLEIHLVKENEILSQSSRSAQKFMHGIRVLMAKNYIDNLSEEVKKGLHTKAAQNLWPSFAPPGYRNVLGETGKRIIVPDPVLGPIITQLFSWFATGEYSLKTLARKAYAEGFRFRKSGNRVPVATLHKILRKRIYTGEFDYAGVRYRGIHDPLVTIEVWNRVQEILDGRQRRRHRLDRPFLYSGLIRCGHCGCSLVAELKKRRYAYYHCTGYRGKCGEPYTREEMLDRHFATLLRALVVAPAILQWLSTELVESDRAEEAAREEGLRRYRAESDRLGARLDVVYEDRLDGRIDAATYDRKFREIRDLDKAVRKKIEMIDQELRIPTSQALDLITRTAAAADSFADRSTAERRQLLDMVVGEAQWKGGELRMSFKEPFEKLRLSNRANSSNYSILRANNALFDIWRRGGDSNPR